MDDKIRLRPLTKGEITVPRIIQQGYGPPNTPDTVLFTDSDEAVLLVKAPDGSSPLIDKELRKHWLRLAA